MYKGPACSPSSVRREQKIIVGQKPLWVSRQDAAATAGLADWWFKID